jgi:hypothetical protein
MKKGLSYLLAVAITVAIAIATALPVLAGPDIGNP